MTPPNERKAAERQPSPAELRLMLRYDPESGSLHWLQRSDAPKFWNTKWAGKPAFTALDNHGYRIGSVANRTLKAHRVIWAIVHGAWPEDMIDHRDGDRSNNRLANLRLASNTENQRNTKSLPGSSSRFLGVRWEGARDRWRAEIRANGKKVHLGYFVDETDAAMAYDAAAAKHFGEFASLNMGAKHDA
jgi:HNH endonuclease/AP2 domain